MSSLDTKYRPPRYGEVLGQDPTVTILCQYIKDGDGRKQSYLFGGPHGSGKTTLGRILARALLCEAPVEGEPCDKCLSCKSMLEWNSSVDYVEVDAATNSGKAEIQKIQEEILYSTFSGRRRVYLFDESHRLSKEAVDALLKPLEEDDPASGDKKLVCIFCTTEPEGMKETILSRCAPAFIIRPVEPARIGKHLEGICEAEGIEYDPEMLRLIAEIKESHIRDALKAVEGVSKLGPINEANVSTFLHLDHHALYTEVLENLGSDLVEMIRVVGLLMERTSPLTCYRKLGELALKAFHTTVGGVKLPGYWDADRVKALGVSKGASLLGVAMRLSDRPGRPTGSMLLCDLSYLHQVGDQVRMSLGEVTPVVVQAAAPMQAAPPEKPAEVVPPVVDSPSKSTSSPDPVSLPTAQSKVVAGSLPEKVEEDPQPSIYVNPLEASVDEDTPRQKVSTELSCSMFSLLLGLRVVELRGKGTSGSSGRTDLDSH